MKIRKEHPPASRSRHPDPATFRRSPLVDESAQRIGFIGLGDMGGPMAANIAKAGFDLTVFDLRDEAMSALEVTGAQRAASVKALANAVDVLCWRSREPHENAVFWWPMRRSAVGGMVVGASDEAYSKVAPVLAAVGRHRALEQSTERDEFVNRGVSGEDIQHACGYL